MLEQLIFGNKITVIRHSPVLTKYCTNTSETLAPNVIKLRNNPHDCVIPTKEEYQQTCATNRDSSFVGMTNKHLT